MARMLQPAEPPASAVPVPGPAADTGRGGVSGPALGGVGDLASAQARLAASEERHRLLAEHANDVVWTMSLDGRITYISPAILAVRGLTPEQAMSQGISEIHPPESMAISLGYFQRLAATLAAGGVPEPFRTDLEYYHADGSTIWCDVQVIPHLRSSGELVEILGVSRDITAARRQADELRLAHEEAEAANRALAAANQALATANVALAAANAELARLATTDTLTGVANRRGFERAATLAVRVAERYLQPVSLLLLDIDHFKMINDTRGHHVGDQALTAVADRLASRLRRSDLLGRWGGEEFVVLLPHTDLADAVRAADQLREVVSAGPVAGDVKLTISGGAAQLTPNDTLTTLLARADRGLFAAKSAGRDRIVAAPNDHQLPPAAAG